MRPAPRGWLVTASGPEAVASLATAPLFMVPFVGLYLASEFLPEWTMLWGWLAVGYAGLVMVYVSGLILRQMRRWRRSE